MLKTGKPISGGQPFRRKLISEYIAQFTLDNYVAYYDLKKLMREAHSLRLECEARKKQLIEDARKKREKSISGSFEGERNCPRTEKSFQAHIEAVDLQEANGFKQEHAAPSKPKCGTVSRSSVPMTPVDVHGTKEMLRADPVFMQLSLTREAIQEQFFHELEKSYRKVKCFLFDLEKKIILKMMELHKLTEAKLREEVAEDYIPEIYLQLECVLKYRELNLLALRKIMTKFLQRNACDNLDLQRRVFQIDEVISRSNAALPSLDLRGAALEVIRIYGTVYRYSYEEAVAKLSYYVHRSGVVTPRIIPDSETFFATTIPCWEPLGAFCIRVLAGTRSLFMEKMLAEVLHCSRNTVSPCTQFPNGEINIKMPSTVRGDDVYVVQSIASSEVDNLSNSGALMELLLLMQAAQLSAAARVTAVIPYLAYTRNVASIAALAEMIELAGCNHVITVDMNSCQVEGMFSVPLENVSPLYEFVRYITNELRKEGHDFANLTVVAPNGRQVARAKDFADALMSYAKLDSVAQFVPVCTAVKGPARGQRGPKIPCDDDAPSPSATSPRANAPPAHLPRATTPQSAGEAVVRSSSPPCPEDRTYNSSLTLEATSMSFADPHRLASPFVWTGELGSPAAAPPIAPLRAGAMGNAAGRSEEGPPGRRLLSCTRGMEKALAHQQKGRGAIVMETKNETPTEHKDIHVVGEIKGRLCIIAETEINEAVETSNLAKCLAENGAERILVIATHAVLAGGYRQRLLTAPIERIIVTDTITQDEILKDPALAEKFRILPIAPLLARAIEKIHTENNLATLFDR